MLKEYILVDSEAIGVEVFRLNAQNHWKPQVYKDLTSLLEIRTLGLSVPLKEIYKDTGLPNTGYGLTDVNIMSEPEVAYGKETHSRGILEMERASVTRHEYFRGAIFAMAAQAYGTI